MYRLQLNVTHWKRLKSLQKECASLPSRFLYNNFLLKFKFWTRINQFSSHQAEVVEPGCRLPQNFSGDWINTANIDADVFINETHIIETWYPDEGRYRRTIYVCRYIYLFFIHSLIYGIFFHLYNFFQRTKRFAYNDGSSYSRWLSKRLHMFWFRPAAS